MLRTSPARPGEAPEAPLPGVDRLGDFTTDRRVLLLCAMALVVGALGAVVAWCLYRLIGLITNLAFYTRWSWSFVSPEANRLGPWEILVPVLGALAVGLMARFGSERIRGHGIPEAMEAILVGGSRIAPRVAFLKPVSSAISIGTGGPFGAEGPIIMTGGAFGSLFAQYFRLSAAERKTLLVAGAASGMAATFGTPVAAVLLAVELLLFEWKPRSYIPVALAAAEAAALRGPLLGPGPIFPLSAIHPLPWAAMAAALGVGLVAGAASAALTGMVYGFEDLFRRLPLHWMWWPALGGVVIGAGGLLAPRALGVGYDSIQALLLGRLAGTAIVALLLTKALVWSFSLGSGTSGGVLAPLLLMGGCLGALEAHVLPVAWGSSGTWALISMAAMVAGTMRSPFTAVVFALELTHAVDLLPPLLVAATAADLFTVLALRRSILTEKVARRGHHVVREYAVDPLELLRVAEVMTRDVEALDGGMCIAEARSVMRPVPTEAGGGARRRHQGYPVVDDHGRVLGVVTLSDLTAWEAAGVPPDRRLAEVMNRPPVVVHPDEPVSRAADRMARAQLGRVPVVARDDGRLLGIVSRSDLLQGRLRRVVEEVDRERVLRAGVRVRVLRAAGRSGSRRTGASATRDRDGGLAGGAGGGLR